MRHYWLIPATVKTRRLTLFACCRWNISQPKSSKQMVLFALILIRFALHMLQSRTSELNHACDHEMKYA